MILTTALPKSKNSLVFPLETTSLQTILQVLKETKARKIYLMGDDPATLLKTFKSKLPVVQAGGGLVRNQSGKMLFIFRKGKWDLPKGKLENNEDVAEGAVREVEEECGIKDLTLEHKLIQTYHTYSINGKMVLKETHWYLMNSTYSGAFIPQIEEGIEKVEWRSKNDIPELMKNSFSSIKKVIDSERN